MKHLSLDLKKSFNSSGCLVWPTKASGRQKEYRGNLICEIKFCRRHFERTLIHLFKLLHHLFLSPDRQNKMMRSSTVSLAAHFDPRMALVLLQHTGVQFQSGAAVVLRAEQLLSPTPQPPPTSTQRGGVSTDGDDPGVRASVHSKTYYVTQRTCLGGVFARWSIPWTAWAWTSHSSVSH